MKTIDFTDGELSALVQLLDIAVKSQGLNVAEAAVALVSKVSQASAPEPEVTTESEIASSVEPPDENWASDDKAEYS